jgi:hypothetical protein
MQEGPKMHLRKYGDIERDEKRPEGEICKYKVQY